MQTQSLQTDSDWSCSPDVTHCLLNAFLSQLIAHPKVSLLEEYSLFTRSQVVK